MLQELIDAVNAYRLEHSRCEASEHKSAELNDTYVRMLQACDASQHALAGGRLSLVRVYDESEVEEVGVGEYRLKSAAQQSDRWTTCGCKLGLAGYHDPDCKYHPINTAPE